MPVQSQTDFRPLTEASAKLPGELRSLIAGSKIAVCSRIPSQQSLTIKLSHPLAPHQPSFHVQWVFQVGNRRFALLEQESFIEPDDRTEPDIQTVVEVIDGKTIAVIADGDFANALPVLKEAILERRSLAPVQWNQKKMEDLRQAFELS
jgi:hypothetical protein